jgi:hypothetical protein
LKGEGAKQDKEIPPFYTFFDRWFKNISFFFRNFFSFRRCVSMETPKSKIIGLLFGYTEKASPNFLPRTQKQVVKYTLF